MQRTRISDVLKIISGLVLFFLIIALYVIEFGYINYTFEVGSMILSFLPFSLSLAVILFIWLHRYTDELFQKFVMAIAILAVLIALSPLTASLINRSFAGPLESKGYDILRLNQTVAPKIEMIEAEVLKVDGYVLEIKTETGSKTFNIQDTSRLDIRNGIIYLPVRQGFLGFDYITEL